MNQSFARPIAVTDSDFADKVLRSDKPVLVDFWAGWCAPCLALGPVIESLAEEFGERVTVAKVDVDSSQGTAMQYAIRSIPTVMLFDKGQVVETFVGVRPRNQYSASLERTLA